MMGPPDSPFLSTPPSRHRRRRAVVTPVPSAGVGHLQSIQASEEGPASGVRALLSAVEVSRLESCPGVKDRG